MKSVTRRIVSLLFCFIGMSINTFAEERKSVPAGMEVIEAGRVQIIVPRGKKIYQRGSVVTTEGNDEFLARRFLEFDTHISDLEARNVNLTNQVYILQQQIQELQSRLLFLEDAREADSREREEAEGGT